jgi:hypothetical protein
VCSSDLVQLGKPSLIILNLGLTQNSTKNCVEIGLVASIMHFKLNGLETLRSAAYGNIKFITCHTFFNGNTNIMDENLISVPALPSGRRCKYHEIVLT